jgi:hypothetical protein
MELFNKFFNIFQKKQNNMIDIYFNLEKFSINLKSFFNSIKIKLIYNNNIVFYY